MKVFINDKVDRIDFLDERFYKVGEEYYPSVTHILDAYPKGEAFKQWLKDVGNQAGIIASKAAEKGSLVHKAIEDLLDGVEIEWNDSVFGLDEWMGVNRFLDFWNTYKPKMIGSEVLTVSEKHKYAGTTDLVCSMNKEKWLIDFKFSNYVHNTHFLQLAAYKRAWEEQNPKILIDRVGILHLKAKTRGTIKGKIQGKGWNLVEPKHDIKTLLKVFDSTHEIFNHEHPNLRPKNLIYPSRLKLGQKTTV